MSKKLLNINEVKMCLADKIVTFQLFHPKRILQDNCWKVKRLTEPWAIAPTTKTMGSSFGITSFNFTRLSEWNEVPESEYVTELILETTIKRLEFYFWLILLKEKHNIIFRQLQRKAFKSKAITLKITWNNSGLTMGLKSHCIYLFYVGSE